jgi:hypothetical protein
VIDLREVAMERFIAVLTWIALAAAVIAAFVVRHEPQRRNARHTHQTLRRAGPSDRAAGS